MRVPAALAAAALMVLLARRGGATSGAVGAGPENVPRGVRAGLIAGIPIGAIVALGAFLPATGEFFREERIVHAGALGAAHEVLVHIPLATVAAEELMFRGALEAILSQRRSPAEAALISAALFGAWHVLPALDALSQIPRSESVHSGGKRGRRWSSAVSARSRRLLGWRCPGCETLRQPCGTGDRPLRRERRRLPGRLVRCPEVRARSLRRCCGGAFAQIAAHAHRHSYFHRFTSARRDATIHASLRLRTHGRSDRGE